MPGKISFEPINVAIIGAGLGGLSAAISLRRAGHNVTVYERYHFAGEVGASLSCASNGSRWLEEWGVDIRAAKPIILERLIRHRWADGKSEAEYPLGDYREKFGTDYNNFHRIDLHKQLLETATSQTGAGTPAKLAVDHKLVKLDAESGTINFENGVVVQADLVVASDGIRSQSRELIGITPQIVPSTSCCYRCIIDSSKLKELGLDEFVTSNAIEFWGGFGINKIVMSPCSDGEVVSCYCFYPADFNNLRQDGWNISATPEQLIATYPDLDPRLHTLFTHANDIKQWRLYIHSPYATWHSGRVCLLGDAAHPMLPDQSQGACMAIEDGAALGLVFGQEFGNISVEEGIQVYERVRKPRATRLQDASRLAREDLDERIGWSAQGKSYEGKLTIEDVCGYNMRKDVAKMLEELRSEV